MSLKLADGFCSEDRGAQADVPVMVVLVVLVVAGLLGSLFPAIFGAGDDGPDPHNLVVTSSSQVSAVLAELHGPNGVVGVDAGATPRALHAPYTLCIVEGVVFPRSIKFLSQEDAVEIPFLLVLCSDSYVGGRLRMMRLKRKGLGVHAFGTHIAVFGVVVGGIVERILLLGATDDATEERDALSVRGLEAGVSYWHRMLHRRTTGNGQWGREIAYFFSLVVVVKPASERPAAWRKDWMLPSALSSWAFSSEVALVPEEVGRRRAGREVWGIWVRWRMC